MVHRFMIATKQENQCFPSIHLQIFCGAVQLSSHFRRGLDFGLSLIIPNLSCQLNDSEKWFSWVICSELEEKISPCDPCRILNNFILSLEYNLWLISRHREQEPSGIIKCWQFCDLRVWEYYIVLQRICSLIRIPWSCGSP